MAKGFQRAVNAVCRYRNDYTVLVQKISDGLHLRQYKPSFRRLNILRHDKKNKSIFPDDWGGQAWHVIIFRKPAHDCFTNGCNAAAVKSADGNRAQMTGRVNFFGDILSFFAKKVDFINDRNHRRFLRL